VTYAVVYQKSDPLLNVIAGQYWRSADDEPRFAKSTEMSEIGIATVSWILVFRD
jgi:hypothetical protein